MPLWNLCATQLKTSANTLETLVLPTLKNQNSLNRRMHSNHTVSAVFCLFFGFILSEEWARNLMLKIRIKKKKENKNLSPGMKWLPTREVVVLAFSGCSVTKAWCCQPEVGLISLIWIWKGAHILPVATQRCWKELTEKTDGLICVMFPRRPVPSAPQNSAIIGNEVEREKNKGMKV